MTPTPPLRPIHPWPGVARGLGARVKGHVLPDSPKSAPLTGGRFRRPAKTHGGTPSGAHFSHHLRVWRPAGGAGEAPGRRPRVRGPPRVTGCGRAGPIRVRRRRRVTGPRRRRCAERACGTVPRKREAIKHSARRASHDGPPRGARRRCHPPGCGLGVERHPTPCDHEAWWGAYMRIYPLPLLPIFPGKRPRRGDLGGGSHFVFCRDWLPPQSAGKRDSVGRGNTGWHEMDEGAPFEKNGNHRVGVKIYIRFTLALHLN